MALRSLTRTMVELAMVLNFQFSPPAGYLLQTVAQSAVCGCIWVFESLWLPLWNFVSRRLALRILEKTWTRCLALFLMI